MLSPCKNKKNEKTREAQVRREGFFLLIERPTLTNKSKMNFSFIKFMSICDKIDVFCEEIDVFDPEVSLPYWCIYDDENCVMYKKIEMTGRDALDKVKRRIKKILAMTEEEFCKKFEGADIELFYDYNAKEDADGDFVSICDIRKPY